MNCSCHLPCSLSRFSRLSRDETPYGSQPAFARDNVAGAQSLSARLQSGIRLLHPPIPAAPWARLTVCFPIQERPLLLGELRAYHVSRECQSGLGLASSPVARRLRQVSSKHLNLATYLLVQACQHLWLVLSNDVYQRFTCVALYHSILVPDHRDASSHSRFSRLGCRPYG